jgi:hypothetical protein
MDPYLVSIGIVEEHSGGHYIVRTRDGRVVGLPARGEPSPEAFESDLVDPPSPQSQVPAALTPRQLRLWLLSVGIPLAAIDAQLTDDAARIEWEYSLEIRREHPLVAHLAAALGLSDAQVDDAFRTAAML